MRLAAALVGAQLTRLPRPVAVEWPGGLPLNHGIAAGAPDHDQLGAGLGDFIEDDDDDSAWPAHSDYPFTRQHIYR